MINREAAQQLVQTYLDQLHSNALNTLQLVVLDEYTREEEFGWVFFYDSQRHHETSDVHDAIGGNAPIIVNKYDGSLHVTGTAFSIDHDIQRYVDQVETETGRWCLAIVDTAPDIRATLSVVREVLDLSVQEVGNVRKNIPGVIRRGSRADLAPIVEALQARGIHVELQECAKA